MAFHQDRDLRLCKAFSDYYADGSATVLNVITLFLSAKNDAGALFSDPTPLLLMGSSGANWFHWSMAFDLVAYLSFAPIAVFVYSWFRAHRPNLVLLYTIGGVSYSLIGSIGAVLLGVVIPTLAREYPTATPSQQEAMQVMIRVFYSMVVRGLWNPLACSRCLSVALPWLTPWVGSPRLSSSSELACLGFPFSSSGEPGLERASCAGPLRLSRPDGPKNCPLNFIYAPEAIWRTLPNGNK
jgi:hypothetical protein